MEKVLNLYKKYEEIINYLIFGVLTTLVSILSYALFSQLFKINYHISTVIAWIISVSFAFITNKIFVFKSNKQSIKASIIECIKFFASRLFTLAIDLILKTFFVEFLHINDMIATIINQFIIIVLNYILSKLIVFKK